MLKVTVNLIIITTDIPNRKKYVVSSSKDSIVFPKLEINKDNKEDINKTIGDFVRKEYLLVSDYELMPQLVSLNERMLCNDENELAVLYACVVPNDAQYNTEKCFWTEFDLMGEKDNQESYLLMYALKQLV